MSTSDLEHQLALLRQRVEKLEQAQWLNLPFAPPQQLEPYKKCRVCGISLSDPMGYVCGCSSCPHTPRIT